MEPLSPPKKTPLYQQIDLIDWCLIIIMLILLTHSIFNLFYEQPSSEMNNDIDKLVRGSIASIFGYFISAHFLNNSAKRNNECVCNVSDEPKDTHQMTTKNVQILIVGLMGILSLGALIIARNIIPLTMSALPAVSAFRDIIYGCVGFLIGYPHNKSDHSSGKKE